MLRKTFMLVAVCLVCMPLGGLVSSAGGGPQGYVTPANALMDSWMLDPALMLVLCVMLLTLAKTCQSKDRATG